MSCIRTFKAFKQHLHFNDSSTVIDFAKISFDHTDIEDILTLYKDFRYTDLLKRVLKDKLEQKELQIGECDDYLMSCEAVRPMLNSLDIRKRTNGDKKMYGLFHQQLPLKPLVFCSLLFQNGIDLNNFQDKISKAIELPEILDTAVFYSINSPYQLGIAGEFLKQIIRSNNTLKNFITFSPIPKLRDSYNDKYAVSDEAVREHLERDCPVYKFHTENGARLHAVLPNADTSDQGIRLSFGWQASYVYRC
jgi:hypothetical protein